MSQINTLGGSGGGGSGIQTINGDTSFVTGSTVTLTGGTTGLAFNGNGTTTMTMVANYLNLPILTAAGTTGYISINGTPTMYVGVDGRNNVFGFGSGPFDAAGWTGIQNTIVGWSNSTNITSGSSNTCVGAGVGANITSGSENTAIGVGTLNASSGLTGSNNTVVGYNSGETIHSTGAGNSCFGSGSGSALTTGINNTCIGYDAGDSFTTGNTNTLVGFQAGIAYTTSETGNIILGGSNGTMSESNITRIGYVGNSASQAACYVDGITGVSVTGVAVLVSATGQLGVAASSERFKENINDMGSESDALMSLRPVTFNYKQDATKSKSFGLIAEEVNELIPELVQLDKEGNPFTVKYNELPALLLNEIQKLNKRIAELEQRLN